MFPQELTEGARELLIGCRVRNMKLALAESCTGGLLSAILTDIPGSSEVFDRAFITYSNAAKNEMIGVPAAILQEYGAVSAEAAALMAEGALKSSSAQLSAAVTGIAGPGGGSAQKPVGLVFIATARPRHEARISRFQFDGSRHSIRLQACAQALTMLQAEMNLV